MSASRSRQARWRLRPRRVLAAVARRALIRRLDATPPAGANRDRVVILLSSAWGMGGTIRAALNVGGWLAQTRDVEIICPYRRRDEPFFGSFPAGVQVTALVDERAGHAPAGFPRLLHRLPSVLFPRVDRLNGDHSLLTDLRLVRRLRGRRGILIATRPGLNLMLARMRPRGYITVGLEQMHLDHHRPRLRRPIERLYPRLDAVVALTTRDAQSYRAMLSDPFRVAVIPNTVRPLAGPEPHLGTTVAVAAGRLGNLGQKGFDLLIEAWVPVAERHPNWRLRIVGEGAGRQQLEALRERLGLAGAVALPGATSDMGTALADGSIFVLSSRYEGFPLILLEAMSKGLAVASFDCPTGPADIIDDRRNGLLVPERDVESLSRAILELIEDEALRRRCAEAAPESARGFTIEAVGPRWDAFLAELQRPASSPSAFDARTAAPDAGSPPAEAPERLIAGA